MKEIRFLDETLINQMAAGEVVEHPSSVVKELIENSLDAGASEIRVDLLSGGRTLIRVTDNGSGISEKEIPLAFARHATSKITKLDDLFSIGTLGFRGEALASIASVSRVTLLTSTDGHQGGFYQIDGGAVVEKGKSHRTQGTTIEVKDLFYNVPVRKKFLPAPDRLTHEVHRVIRGLSLARPEVAFSLTVDQKPQLQLLKTQEGPFLARLKERLGQLDPEKLKEEWIPLVTEEGDFFLRGWLLGPAFHRPNRTEETLIVNQRLVDPYLISLAVREGFGPSLPDHRHPIFLLHLDLPGGIVDVNVHPQKREVRLREKSRLHQFISKGIERVLYPISKNFHREEIAPAPLSIKWSHDNFLPPSHEWELKSEPSFFPQTLRPKIAHCFKGAIVFDPLSIPPLLSEVKEGLALLSIKKGYQKLLKEKSDSPLGKQALLLPPVITLSLKEEERLELCREKLMTLGFDIEFFGGKGHILRTIPSGFEEKEAIELLKSVLGGSQGQEEVFSHRLLSHEEAEQFLIALSNLSQPTLAIDGKPLIKLLTLEDLLSR
jgi:DNA mismatch repair protein MutL